MTQQDKAEPNNRSRYDRCDPHYLRELREAAGMDWVVLARTACMSVAQVRALESENGGDVFYSDTIKRQAYKRLLMILGAEPPTVEVPESMRDAHHVAEAHLNTLDQIVAMSHQPPMNFTWADRLRDGVNKLIAHQQLVGAVFFLASAVVLFALYGPLHWLKEPTQIVSATAKPEQLSAPEPAAVAASTPPAQVLPTTVAAPVASAPVAAASVAVVSAPVGAASATVIAKSPSGACAFTSDALPQLAPFVARKEGSYVYVVSSSSADVCVVDGNKQATQLQLKAGESRTVTGTAPWQLSGTQLKDVQIYFQGGRVSLPEDIQRLTLVEQPVTR